MNNRRRRLVLGGLLVAVGIQTLGVQSGWWEGGSILQLWPVALVLAGVGRGLTGPGILWFGYGIVLLLSTTGVWRLSEAWPLLLVLHGVVLLGGRTLCRQHEPRAGRDGIHAN